jgi:hypothetical protein
VTPTPDATTLVRRAIVAYGTSEILTLVDSLNLQPSARVDVVIVAPLRNLHRSRNVEAFASNAPTPAVRFLAELISQDALSRVVELLGDHADEPTLEELTGGVDALLAEEVAPSVVAMMLALAAANGVPAAPHCELLLDSRPEFSLPVLNVVAPASPLAPAHVVDPKVREQRAQRREAQKQLRQRQNSRPSSRPAKTKTAPPRPVTPALSPLKDLTTPANAPVAPPAPVVASVPVIERRRVHLTPHEEERFSTDHPLSGTVIALDVPFDAANTEELGVSAKIRPVLVVAGAAEELLVLPIFTSDGPGRVSFASWKQTGLDHASFLSLDRVTVTLEPSTAIRRIGRLNDQEWNALI